MLCFQLQTIRKESRQKAPQKRSSEKPENMTAARVTFTFSQNDHF